MRIRYNPARASRQVRHKLPELMDQICHLNGGNRSLSALVSRFCARAIDGLLKILYCNHAISDRDTGISSDLPNSSGNFRREIIEVGGVSANQAANTHYGIASARVCQFFGDYGNLPCA